MAVDTPQKRASSFLLGFLPFPADSQVTQADRQQLLRVYSGVEAALPPEPLPLPATASQIDDALRGRYGPVSYTFRYEKSNLAGQYLGEIKSVLECTIELNNHRDILRTARVVLDPDIQDVDPTSDFIAPVMELVVPLRDGEVRFADIPLGNFKLSIPVETIHEAREVWAIQARDVVVELATRYLTDPLTIDASTNVLTWITTLLTDEGIPEEMPTDSLTATTAWTWAPKTSLLTVINDLLDGINYYRLYSTRAGKATTRERVAYGTEATVVTFGDSTHSGLLLEPMRVTVDYERVSNEVVVVVDDPQRAPIWSYWVNDCPACAISTVNQGKAIFRRVQRDTVPDIATAHDIAKMELRNSWLEAYQLRLLTTIDPRREPHENYELSITGSDHNNTYRALSWRMPLTTGGQMQHTVGKVGDLLRISSRYEARTRALSFAAYWRFGEATGASTAANVAPLSTTTPDTTYDGTYSNVTLEASGLVVNDPDKAATFNGTTSNVSVSSGAAIEDIFTGGGSVAFIFKPGSDGENNLGRVFDKTEWGVYVSAESGGNVALSFFHNFDGADGVWVTAVDIPINEAAHVVITYDSDAVANNPTFYINGLQRTVGSGLTESGTPTGSSESDVGDDLYIGNRSAGDRTFDGEIDEPALFSDTLTAAEAYELAGASGLVV